MRGWDWWNAPEWNESPATDNDTRLGAAGDDFRACRNGRVQLFGGDRHNDFDLHDNVRVACDGGTGTLAAGGLDATLLGGQGDDQITGSAANATRFMDGGSGNDRLTGGGSGNDWLAGGSANDTLLVAMATTCS